MSAPHSAPVRLVYPALRWVLLAFVALATLAWVALYLASERTDQSFAWTIEPPLTAAALGAGYGGALVMFLLAVRERVWANVRIAVVPPLVLSAGTLAATLIHIDRFHLSAEALVPRTVAWVWLVVYVAVVPALAGAYWWHHRRPGRDPEREFPVPGWLSWLLSAQGVLLVGVGLALFIAPAAVGQVWPWELTALTGRAIAAWLVGLGAAAALATVENDLRRLRAGIAGYAVIAALLLGALLRYGADVRWDSLAAWVFLATVVSMLPMGVYPLWMTRHRAAVELAQEPGQDVGRPG